MSEMMSELLTEPISVEMLKEYASAESVREVVLLTATNNEAGVMTEEMVEAHAVAITRLESAPPVAEPTNDELKAKLEGLLKELAELKPPAPKRVVTRGGRSYRLLKKDVAWSTKPQVHAIMQIVGAHMQEGEVRTEEEIVEMMVQNEAVLQTKQGGKRIWDYYKGEHNEGLVAHGNMEKI